MKQVSILTLSFFSVISMIACRENNFATLDYRTLNYDTNKITIFDREENETAYERKPKQQVAKDIVDKIITMLYD